MASLFQSVYLSESLNCPGQLFQATAARLFFLLLILFGVAPAAGL
ncbi:hypothetical protein EIKCOROL_01352 [Eikenella corrodens ATCC 23834]|uniref:Uncharacterized protein n=1 Tax=Eikenella corrodens ATCC 23834 TaxID=546274 RepID=C0DVG3_EIKCO|nr:hypothetical protein EIKCOROL_01352 [Eikenella corrodens ATCC 23834]